jgi:hypothetical protein
MSPYIKVQKVTNKMPDQATPYYCELCDFKSSKKSNYDIHLTTAKHKKVTNDDINQSIKCHICQCGKEFKYRQGLSRHRKKCFEPGQIEPPPQPSSQVDMTVVLELLKQNQEFKDLVIEQTKQLFQQNQQNAVLQEQLLDAVKDGKLGNNNNINTNCNNNNKFNLNFFLNETCKDAITFSDFINSIEVTMDEFIQTGNTGFVSGISKVLMDRIKGMDLHTRPLHCTDFKRETVYIKNEDKWDKEDGDNTHLRKAVKCVAKKNYNQLHNWYNHKKPEVETLGTEECEDYFKFYKSALGGYDKEEDKKFEDKIIKNVLKEVILDKSITDAE